MVFKAHHVISGADLYGAEHQIDAVDVAPLASSDRLPAGIILVRQHQPAVSLHLHMDFDGIGLVIKQVHLPRRVTIWRWTAAIAERMSLGERIPVRVLQRRLQILLAGMP